MSGRSMEGKTAWYRRKPALLFFLVLSIILFVISLASNFIPAVSRDRRVHEENGTFLMVLQICTTFIAFCYMVLMMFRWFVNIFTHRAPRIFTLVADVVFCVVAAAMTAVFLIFGDSALQKCAFWTGVNLLLNTNEFIVHLVHKQKAENQNLLN